MNNNEITVDSETIKLIAAAAAEAAASKIADQFREEFRTEIKLMKDGVFTEVHGYFGDTTPAAHLIQHNRIDKLLALFDKMGENLLATALKYLLMGLLAAGVVGYVLYHRIFGG